MRVMAMSRRLPVSCWKLKGEFMKSWNMLLWAGGVACWAMMSAPAQAPQTSVEPPAGGSEFRPASQGSVEQVLKRMKLRNPEEFERLNKLRQEDPDAFRKALKDRLDKVRGGPPSDRIAADVASGSERGQAIQHARNPASNASRDDWMRRYPELGKREQDIRTLVENYKAAAPDEQKKLQADLKKKISETFELREKLRQEAIQRVETQLARLKKDAAPGKANREAIVERRFKELTEGNAQTH